MTMESRQQKEMLSAIFKTRETSKSLRTTIPEAIVQTLKIKEKDMLDWQIEAVGSELVLRVKVVRGKKMSQDENDAAEFLLMTESSKKGKPTLHKTVMPPCQDEDHQACAQFYRSVDGKWKYECTCNCHKKKS